jgi:Tfp pilus assembly protein PilP
MIRRHAAAGFILLCLCGCTPEEDVKAQLQELRSGQRGRVPPLPVLPPVVPLRYEVGRLPDPFFPAGK